MDMKPMDGVVADPEQTWCLADDRNSTVLLYSLSGPTVTLLKALSRDPHSGVWFDPRTGNTRPLATPISAGSGATIEKPTAESWLLLLR
jgi:hypothetical protein